eukprot:g6606.t1
MMCLQPRAALYISWVEDPVPCCAVLKARAVCGAAAGARLCCAARAVAALLEARAVAALLEARAVAALLEARAVAALLEARAVAALLEARAVAALLEARAVAALLEARAVAALLEARAVAALLEARAVAALLEVLGEPKVFAVLGGSMGGMQALMYERLSAIACTGATSPSTVALRSIQRKAVLADPAYQGGCYPDGCGPVSGMGVARAIGTICYRSRNEFDERFEWKARPDHSFQVESYLSHQAKKFQTSFDANCWLLLSRNMDLMDMGRGFPNFAKGVTRIPQDKEVMLLSIKQDALIQSKEMTMLASILGAHGVKVHYEELSSKFGHDAFLLEQDMFNPRLNAFLGAAGGEGHDGVDAVRALIREMHE